MNLPPLKIYVILCLLIISCSSDDDNNNQEPNNNETVNCNSNQTLNSSRGACDETLAFGSEYELIETSSTITINSNSIPEHNVGLFGGGQGSLNPNAISPQSMSHTVTKNPSMAASVTPLLGEDGPDFAFGILFNGLLLDPVAAEPFPHTNMMDPNVNWEWNLEAMNVLLGLDCNNAHVQPNGKYHYHSSPTLYLESLNVQSNTMTMIGYAADGFPIYYKYAYSDPDDATSTVIEMNSSYELKSGNRPGDGVTAPCDVYNGVYSNDYQYTENLGHLDDANGRYGVTPEYPGGTYYYILTEAFPSIPRYFKGTPSNDFKVGR